MKKDGENVRATLQARARAVCGSNYRSQLGELRERSVDGTGVPAKQNPAHRAAPNLSFNSNNCTDHSVQERKKKIHKRDRT